MENNLQKILDIVDEISYLFDDFELLCIKKYIKSNQKELFLPDVIRELYDKLHLISDDENIYVAFLKLLEKQHDLKDKHIIEVGGGIFPSLARRISLLQDKGTITVYDPRLSKKEKSTEHMKLVRRMFTRNTDIADTDLLIGFMPCKGAEALVDSAIAHNVDFMVALCEGGPHGDIHDYFESDEEWIDSMIYRANRGIEDQNMGRLQIQYLKEFGDPYPIISNKRK